MEPDILIVDEALSVGDARFKRKSLQKMKQLCDRAGTILLVSHSLGTIKELSDEVLWMHKGQAVMRDEPEAVVGEYTRFLDVGESDVVAMEDV
jgi:ABC-type polysaccharide/polyol phosphate transport system ATPase subunit